MKGLTRHTITITCFLFFCNSVFAQANPAYQKEIDDWHVKRIQELKADDGWLNLVGLYWLQEGKSSFGSGAQNKIVFPKGSIDDVAGCFERTGNIVKLVVADNVAIGVNNKPAKEALVFQENPTVVPIISFGSLRWNIIKRDDKIGIRLRDLASPAPAAFTGVDRFPVDSAWRIPAILKPQLQAAAIDIRNVIGQTTKQKSPGKLVFAINNKQYTLDALDQGSDLLIVFGDATSGNTTYPAGRFIDVKKPGADGNLMIDFNEAYNPPCAFTNYATCPLPPPQNILPIEVTAGEKDYGNHH